MACVYVAPPDSPNPDDLNALAQVLEASRAVKQAWLVGRLNRTIGGGERTDTTIVFVVDDPRVDSERPELRKTIAELDEVASGIGLMVKSWAYVAPIAVEREIGACGVRLYQPDRLSSPQAT